MSEKLKEKLERLQAFFDEVKLLSRELGKSNYITKESIERLIVQYGT